MSQCSETSSVGLSVSYQSAEMQIWRAVKWREPPQFLGVGARTGPPLQNGLAALCQTRE